MLIAERLRAERLEQIIKALQRHRFGRRAETPPEDQLLLGLEDVEQGVADDEAADEASAPNVKSERAARRRANRSSLPAHLPRIETVVDIDDKTCPCCRHGLHVIGEDVAERLDIVPAQFRVIVIRYALSRWEGLSHFLDDGRVEIDSNTVERSIRPLALTRKNALFAGSDAGARHWAVIATLIETCKLNGVDPQAYLAELITRIVQAHPNRDIDDLMPWRFVPAEANLANVA